MCSMYKLTAFFEAKIKVGFQNCPRNLKFGEDVVFMIQNIVLAQKSKIPKNEVMAAILNFDNPNPKWP